MILSEDDKWMQLALEMAAHAAQHQEVPVGAVLVLNNTLISKGANCPIQTNDPTAHAEIICMRAGAKVLNNYRLVDTTLYVTLEPCVMCIGAMIHARIKRCVFGAYDAKAGLVNHQISYSGGILEVQCSRMLSEFFQQKRLITKNSENLYEKSKT